MAVTKLCGDNLRALRPLVRDALDYRQLRGVLADLIEDADPDLAGRLRRLQTYELTLKALDCGRTYEIEAAARCRGLVLRYESIVRTPRLWNRVTPLIGPSGDALYAVAPEECCHLPVCRCSREAGDHYGRVWQWCVRRAHCLALVWRGLDGWGVPPDIEAGLMVLRNSIDFTVSQAMR